MGRDGPQLGFGGIEYLLMTVIDQLAVANWQRAAAGQPRHKQPPKPEPLPRPGFAPLAFKRPRVTAADLVEHKRRHARR